MDYTPTAVDDWSAAYHRPRLKEFGSYLFVLMSAADTSQNETNLVDVLVFAGMNFVLTVHKREVKILRTLFDTASGTGAPLAKGPGYLLFCIADSLVDTFFPAFDIIDGQVAGVESRILSDPREKVLSQLFRIKRHCLNLRKSLGPMRDVFGMQIGRAHV